MENKNDKNIERIKCIIIGSGPAGYTAAIYASRANLKPVLYTGLQIGGQLITTTEIDNFPGYPTGISGPEMMEDLKKQAERFGADIRFGIVTSVDFSEKQHKIIIDDSKVIIADTVIIATGATAKYLGLEAETKYAGQGVSACATCDGFFYRGKNVAVIGGGDTACEEAIYLSRICKKVYLIHRRDELRASKAMQNRVFETPNIEMVWNSQIIKFYGEKEGFDVQLEGITVKNHVTSKIDNIQVEGAFIAIGHQPNSALFKGIIEMDENGYIITKPDSTATNILGIFAAGDIRDTKYRQAITAAASGCMAAIEAERFLCL
jgi:thioredoxin reductase (NADPH)